MPYFLVKQVEIKGSIKRTDRGQLYTLTQKHVHGNIFHINLSGLQEVFSNLPWIDTVTVHRRLPDTIEIKLTEHNPVARWQKSGLINSHGKLFIAITDEALPVFDSRIDKGKIMVERYDEFTQILKPLNLNITRLEYSPRETWLLMLDNGTTIRLGQENESLRLKRFAKIWSSIAQTEKPLYVDMRYRNGFAVRYHDSPP